MADQVVMHWARMGDEVVRLGIVVVVVTIPLASTAKGVSTFPKIQGSNQRHR